MQNFLLSSLLTHAFGQRCLGRVQHLGLRIKGFEFGVDPKP